MPIVKETGQDARFLQKFSTPADLNKINTLPHVVGFKNRIINGCFRMWQRGDIITASISAPTPVYTADRFYTSNLYSGNNARIAVSKESSGEAKMVWAGANPTNQMRSFLGQTIEALECANLWEKEVTVSVEVKAVSNFTACRLVLVTGTTNAAIEASSEHPTGVGFAQNNINISGFTKITFTATLPVKPNNDSVVGILIQPRDPTSAEVIGDGVVIRNLQLEEGPVATPFEYRPISVEEMLCYRYCETVDEFITTTEPSPDDYANAQWLFKVQKRILPAIVFGVGSVSHNTFITRNLLRVNCLSALPIIAPHTRAEAEL